MKRRVIYNGKLAKRKEVRFTLENRGFRYGDGIFETIRIFDGKIPFFEQHFDRLNKGIETLELDLPIMNHGIDALHFEIRRIVKYYRQKYPQQSKNYRLRLAVFRNDGGFYTPLTSKASYILELSFLDNGIFEWDNQGIEVDIFPDVQLSCDKLANLKTSNGLPYILAALYKKKHELDDCLLLNAHGRLAESTHSNLFIINENTLITPDLTEGCTAGTTRQVILQIAASLGMTIQVGQCEVEMLATASEVFLTNAIKGIRWIRKHKEKQYDNVKTKVIFEQLNDRVKASTIII